MEGYSRGSLIMQNKKKISRNGKKLKYDLDEIKRLKFDENLTWDEIGMLFGVIGRTIHVYYNKYTQKSTSNSDNLIETPTGIHEYIRVDSSFLCPCGCGKKPKRKSKYFSRSCRWKHQEILIAEQVAEQNKNNKPITGYILDLKDSITQTKEKTPSPVGSLIPNENTTLLIQSLIPDGMDK